MCPNHKENGCKCKIDKTKIENLVMDTIQYFINNTPLRKTFEDNLIKYVMSKTSAVGGSIKKRLKEIDKEMANLLKAVQQGLNLEIITPKLNELNEEKKTLQVELAKEEVKSRTFTPEHVRYFFKSISFNKSLDDETKKHLINKLIKAVYIRKNKK